MATFGGPKIIKEGLVLVLDSSNTLSYPGTGNIWYDLSGNNNHATIGTSTYVDNSIYLSSTNITIPTNSNLVDNLSLGNYTVITTVKSEDVIYPRSRHPLRLSSTASPYTSIGWAVGHQASSSQIEIRVSDGVTMSVGYVSNNISESTVYQRVFTVDRTNGCTTKYYLNNQYMGQLLSPTVTGPIFSSNGSGIVFGDVQGWRFIGGVYNIMIYNKILTPLEISSNYNMQKLRYINYFVKNERNYYILKENGNYIKKEN